MKNYVALFLLMASLHTAGAQSIAIRPRPATRPQAPKPRIAYVSICESRRAYAYHSGMCRGLARCTHGVSQVSVSQARSAGYVPCKLCY